MRDRTAGNRARPGSTVDTGLPGVVGTGAPVAAPAGPLAGLTRGAVAGAATSMAAAVLDGAR